MVYYIRLLKPPRIFTGKRRKATVKFVITVTTDLGDNFFPDDIELSSCLIDSQYRIKGLGESTKSQWRNGMRSVDVQIDIVNHPDIKWPIRLYILAKGVKESLGLSPDDIPTIIGATSDDIDLGDNREARRRVARIFPTDGPILSIWEETGESIARHIWDAGVALAAYFQKTPKQVTQDLLFPQLQHVCSQAKRPRVIELGSGDLPEAMEILEHNISKARAAKSTTIRAETLNWDQPIQLGQYPSTRANYVWHRI